MKRSEKLKTVTRKDIALAAGVSETVVSYVINGNRYVKEEKRRRVQKAIKELNWRPNTMARALKGKRSNHILFIADDITGEYFGKLIREIDTLAYKKGYFITLCADRADEDFVNRIYSHFFDGVVIGSATFSPANIQRLIDAGVPVVVLEIRDYSSITGVYGLINTGLYDGMRQAVQALYQRGRRDLLFIDRVSSDEIWSDKDDWRLKGYLDECEALGLEGRIVSDCLNEDHLLTTLLEKFEKGVVVDGIIGRNDQMALVAQNACRTMQWKVPEDVSIIGFDNSRLCRFANPTLTSIAISQQKIAQAVIEMLMSLIDERSSFTGRLERYLQTELVMRESV